ncbi:N-formylglutamate amidohydrolase [Nocardioides sp. Bht2]|uniref:N-formylglutamate amidohydrolase n=1 Tax=Nocardioides sp. Bht2 TaxID=3392297 RepID=UPI0039B48F5F
MSDVEPLFLEPGRAFTAEEITFFAGRGERTLEQALADAEVLVSCPHSGAAIPGELRRFLVPEFTRRLQFDYTDCSTAPIVRRWAEIDPSIIYVENPHPRLVRDPNRARPDDLAERLTEALRRVREAGLFHRVDLTGVDAIRPVTFSFFPMLAVPDDAAGVAELVEAFVDAGTRGVDVYQQTREALQERLISQALAGGSPSGSLTALSFHDTMNHTTTRQGAVNVERAPQDRLPAVVALSNRGTASGDPRAEDPAVTMDPARIRLLAQAHRDGFDVADPDDVALNQPDLGSQEIIASGARFRELASEAGAAGVRFDAVQAEFLRELLLGAANAAHIAQPGTDWPEPDAAHVDDLAHRCAASWARYRELVR